ncbi:MAG: ATP--guanido phosphotransferase [Clostridia bacterium]|nr:ATP--guanido phosphotransferase [Clostridia bacterium]
MGYWYNENYGKDNIVISTRVRLARNIENLPFPSKMTDLQMKELYEKVSSATKDNVCLKFILMKDIPENERFALVERHIISKEFATNTENRAIIISEDESIAIMIGEEDHIRIQVISSGFSPEKAYETADKIDNELSRKLPISFDEQLGYITECLTNLGTGLRVSAMLHLPLLEANGKINELAETLGKIGLTIRGMYGEGSKALSSFYQISNQITLGLTEKEAITTLNNITAKIIDAEMNLRKRLDRLQIEDRASRALYILKGAKILSSSEAMKLLSDIMIGQSLELLSKEAIMPIKALITTGPFMLMSKYGDIPPTERDIKRAEILNNQITFTE